MSDVQCGNEEASLDRCAHSGWAMTGECTHNDDVAIICGVEAGTGMFMYTHTTYTNWKNIEIYDSDTLILGECVFISPGY